MILLPCPAFINEGLFVPLNTVFSGILSTSKVVQPAVVSAQMFTVIIRHWGKKKRIT